MQKQTLTLKIILIFIIPTLALIYFSYFFVQDKYHQLEESEKYQFTTKVMKKVDILIDNIQIERGLSAGYLASVSSTTLKSNLLEQYKKTDEAYKKVHYLIGLTSNIKSLLKDEIGYKTKPIMKDVLLKFQDLSTIREEVLSHKISFNDEITFYSGINSKLLDASLTLVFVLQKYNNDNLAIIKLQKLQEFAGQERAYVYNQILSKTTDQEMLKRIRELQIAQRENFTEFLINASLPSIAIYQNIFEFDSEQSLNILREKFEKGTLKAKEANSWFQASTNHIDMLSSVLSNILNSYVKDAQLKHQKALNMLYITLLLWFFSFLALSGLLYMLRRMLTNEEKTAQELRISAYTFDSHEAMTITDVSGTILKINKAFTRITGYDEDEVIGQNPRILKSNKHSTKFFQEMWYKLNTVGKWSGDIYNKRKNGEVYPERLSITAVKNEQGVTTHYIAQFFDITDIVTAKEEAEYQITHDFLTGLVNRKQLSVRLEEEYLKAKRHEYKNAFLFIDLDYFKKVNDTHGHLIGDELLKKFSQRVLETVREEDVVARISGDEFGILISNLNTDEKKAIKSVQIVAQKILDAVKDPFVINDIQLSISSSIGIKIFPANEENVDDVVVHADTAMYKAKAEGKNKYIFFNKEIAENLKKQLAVENEIVQAIENKEFEFYFQPKVYVSSGEIYGAELLARWRHPTKGLLFPDSFIDVATEMGLIHKITILALHTACASIVKYGDLFDGSLAININSQELLENNFELEIINIIASYGIDSSRIELEILEDDIIKDFDFIVEKMHTLKKFGVRFSIDDFGTGYSSITYLKRLPVDTLKIDRSFLMEAETNADQELIDVIVKMAKLFNLEVVAEGVENSIQLECIQDNKTDLYQGYLFSKPIEEISFIEMLKEQRTTKE